MTHKCVFCETRLIPVYRALCGRCFAKVPWDLRIEVLHAFRGRVVNNARYMNALVGLMSWRAEAYPQWSQKGIE